MAHAFRSEQARLLTHVQREREAVELLQLPGELLLCHPNTVRFRLHRIEQRTGRSLARPRDVAELSLALEVHRRLMWQRDHPGRRP